MHLDHFIGQKALVAQLNRLTENGRLGHAYAFSGPDGIGKRTLALAFIQRLLCTGGHAEHCSCISCRTLQEGVNPDFYEVVTEKSSIGVDTIRDLQKDAANRPTYGNRKVYLIDGAELMTPQAQNCLLKTLEEPPEYVIILLTTASFDALLPTIQSRTVNLRMNPYSDEEMRQILSPLYSGTGQDMEFILRFSLGIPGNAIHYLEEGKLQELRQQVISLLEKPDDIVLVENLRKTLTDNREELPEIMGILMSVYRDCLLLKEGMENRLINSDKKDMMIRIASSFTSRKLMDKISSLERMRRNFKYNINFALGIDVLLLEIQEV